MRVPATTENKWPKPKPTTPPVDLLTVKQAAAEHARLAAQASRHYIISKDALDKGARVATV